MENKSIYTYTGYDNKNQQITLTLWVKVGKIAKKQSEEVRFLLHSYRLLFW